MDAQQMDPDFLALLSTLSPEELQEMFFPYGQEQGAIEQEMALAQQLRQRAPERSTPFGALTSGLSNALGTMGGTMLQKQGIEAQRALGGRMQGDAASRLQMLERLLRERNKGAQYEGLDMPVMME